jgi:hypothetical protein
MKQSINKPRTISYHHGAFKRKIKSHNAPRIYAYHVNKTKTETYRYLLNKDGMPSGASDGSCPCQYFPRRGRDDAAQLR